MFHQRLTPVANSLPLSFIVAALPIVAMLVVLGVLRRPAWQAALLGLLVALLIGVSVWQFPWALAMAAIANGVTFALWPIVWIVLNALLLYNVAVKSGSFDAFRAWIVEHLPNDRRVVMVLIGFPFGALLEGIAGFGTPVAITSSLLIMLGFAPLDALVCTLMFNTAPVAFSALGVPITTLAAVTHLPAPVLAQMVGRQLPVIALLLPFYVTTVYAGPRGAWAIWPLLLVAGGAFGVMQFATSNFISFPMTDVVSSLSTIIAMLVFLRRWRPRPDPAFTLDSSDSRPLTNDRPISAWCAWAPWIVVSVAVIVWTLCRVSALGEIGVAWPGLHNAISITLYKGMPYAAVWDFQPLSTGTAILAATIVTAALLRLGVRQILECIMRTWLEARVAVMTIMTTLGLAYLMNYSGLNYTLGLGVSSLGLFFVFFSPFLGWLAVITAGSDTAGNALFGNLQAISANELGLNPVLFAATNSSGGVLGKMVSLPNIAAGAAVTDMRSQEGHVFARTFPHSIVLTLILGALVALQQFFLPWIVPPTHDGTKTAYTLRYPASARFPPKSYTQIESIKGP
jgi:lactate permease